MTCSLMRTHQAFSLRSYLHVTKWAHSSQPFKYCDSRQVACSVSTRSSPSETCWDSYIRVLSGLVLLRHTSSEL